MPLEEFASEEMAEGRHSDMQVCSFTESEGQARVEILGPSGVTVTVTGGIDMSCNPESWKLSQ